MENDWERIPRSVGIYQMRNAQNHDDTQEIRVVLAVLTNGGGLTEVNVYDGIGELQGYYGEYKKIRPFDLSERDKIDPEDFRKAQVLI